MIYRLYIGANNKTKQVEYDRAMALISSYFEGFTAYQSKGYWKGQAENSLIVEISTDSEQGSVITKLCGELKTALQQQAIGLVVVNEGMKFI